MHPMLELKLLVRYHGVKATQYFSKFTDRSISVLKQDLLALGLPHPKHTQITLLSHGLVECYWPSARKHHVLHKHLLAKTQVNLALEEIARSLSITSVTLKEKPVYSSTFESDNSKNLKRPYIQIERDDVTNASGHLRPNKVAKTQAQDFHLHVSGVSNAYNALHGTFQSTTAWATPKVPTTASHIPQTNPNSQMVKAPQTSLHSNGVFNAGVEEKTVNDFLHNLLSEKMTSVEPGPKLSTSATSASTESQSNNLGNARNVRHSGEFPLIPKDTVKYPIQNPEGIPGLNMAREQTIRQENLPGHLPARPSSAPLVNTPQNVQFVTKQVPLSLPRNLKPPNPQVAIPASPSQQGSVNGSKNVYSSTTVERSAEKPHSTTGASYAKFDPKKNRYITVRYASSTTPSASAEPKPHPVSSHNESTNHGVKQPNVLPTVMASLKPTDQQPAVGPSFSGHRASNQRTNDKSSPNIQISSKPSMDPPNGHPVAAPPVASLPPNQGSNPTSAATIRNAPNGNDANSSLLSVDRGPKDLPQLTLMAKALRRRVEELVKKDGEITDELKRLGSAWVPEKLEVVEIGSKGKGRQENERNAELDVLKTKFAAVQKLRAEEAKIRAEERRREEAGNTELELLKKKLEAVQKLRADEAKIRAEERRGEEARNAELELLRKKLEAVQRLRAEEAKTLADEKKRREEAEKAELELLKTKLEAVQILRAEEAKMLAEEQKRRDDAENALADVRRECRQPFVVPSLLDIFVELSKLTTKGLKLTNSADTTRMLGSALNLQSNAPLPPIKLPLSGVSVSQATAAGDTVVETFRVKPEPQDITLPL